MEVNVFERRSAVERESDAAARQTEKSARLAERRERRFRRTPVGQAKTAWEGGDGFFELQLTLGTLTGDTKAMRGTSSHSGSTSYTDLLSQIEAVGWRLNNVGNIFIPTGSISRDKFLSSGQQTAMSGSTKAVYLFRRADPQPDRVLPDEDQIDLNTDGQPD